MDQPAHQLLRSGAVHIQQQARGGYPLRLDAAGRLRGCALGAIAIAAGGDPAQARASIDYRSASRTRYLELLRTARPASQPCPGRGRWPWQGHHWTCAYVTRLGNQIAHLNDRHGWSFERIADWLRQEHGDWLVPVQATEAPAAVADAFAATSVDADELVRVAVPSEGEREPAGVV